MSFTAEHLPSQGHHEDPEEDSFHASNLCESPPPMELKSASDLLAMNDDDLFNYSRRFFARYGDLNITKENSGGLTDHQLHQLQERIRVSRHKLAPGPSSQILHVNLMPELRRRLRSVLENGEIPNKERPRGYCPSSPPCTPEVWAERGLSWKDEESQRRELAWQMENYHLLLSDGGRPVLPPDELKELMHMRFDYPGAHEGMVKPWMYAMPASDKRSAHVYEQQLISWEGFRRWQRYNRGLKDEGGFEEFAIHSWREKRTMVTDDEYDKFLEDIRSPSPSVLQEEWQQEQGLRTLLQMMWREDCESFDDYGPAVEERLARHGFAREFKPNLDPKTQDQLTTWVEYLGHMLWWLDINKDMLEEMKVDAGLREAISRHEDSITDGDDPEKEINIQEAEKHLAEAQEKHRRVAAKGKSKGSVFTQIHFLHEMAKMVFYLRRLTFWVNNEFPHIEREMKSQKSPQATDTGSAGHEVATVAQTETMVAEEEAGTGNMEVGRTQEQEFVEPQDGALSSARQLEEEHLELASGTEVRQDPKNNGTWQDQPLNQGESLNITVSTDKLGEQARKAKAREARKNRLLKFKNPTTPTRRSERIAARQKLKAEEEAKKFEGSASVPVGQLKGIARAIQPPRGSSRKRKRLKRSNVSR